MKNIGSLLEFYGNNPRTNIKMQLIQGNILSNLAEFDRSFDLVLTSPPYGDSRTTVAYGQFSRLSLRWLGIDEYVDRTSLGGKAKKYRKDCPPKFYIIRSIQSQ